MKLAAVNAVLGVTNLALFVAADWTPLRWLNLGVGLLAVGVASGRFVRCRQLAASRRISRLPSKSERWWRLGRWN